MPRLIAPEMLDHLPPEADAAQRSRRDLRRINVVLGNPGWFRRELARRLRPGDRILEIGAGDGHLRRIAPRGVSWDALDPVPAPADWPAGSRWHRTHVQHFDGWAGYSVIVGNLIFHHLAAADLAGLGAALRPHARLLLASEPARSRRSHAGFRLLCLLLRAHPVTQHDGRVSIDAGFRHDELAQALGLTDDGWTRRTRTSWRGASRLIASRPA